MDVRRDVDLGSYTTFGIHASAEYFVEATTLDELRSALAWAREHQAPYRVLGGGSNVLVTADVAGLIILMGIKGRSAAFDGEDVRVTLGAGESWHDVVTWTVEQGWGGLENLALIPGTVGAAPMQNIGAYGVEQAACFVSLTYLDAATGVEYTADKTTCAFGYRESIFKHRLRERAIITSVTYRLSTHPVVHASYADVRAELHANGIDDATIRDVFDAVVAIRKRKLPDPAVLGNAGSFFKNPVIDATHYQRLHDLHPNMPAYEQADGTMKVPAAWLIDHCGWKGHREDRVGVHAHQALVLVNYGDAAGADVLDLATRIAASVYDAYGVVLEREVNVW